MVRPFSIAIFTLGLFTASQADRMVLKDGGEKFGQILDERAGVVRYTDRHDRPRKIEAKLIDTLIYDEVETEGLAKLAYRKGSPTDWTGFLRLRHSDVLDLDVIYATDSISELDVFFRNGVHLRVLPNTRFQVEVAPKKNLGDAQVKIMQGHVIAAGYRSESLLRCVSPAGVGVLRGQTRMALQVNAKDTSLTVICLHGLVGVQEHVSDPGEYVVDSGVALHFTRQTGRFASQPLASPAADTLTQQAQEMGHYLMGSIKYPPIGYLARALTGLGFLLFFYGSTLGILDYVNHL